MSRLTITLTAAAASALVAAATMALPAIGDDSGKPGDDGAATFAQFAACLRSHGLDGAPSTPEALKPWLGDKEAHDPATVKSALHACEPPESKPKFERKREITGPDVQKLVACMRRTASTPRATPTR
jgi:hypothetical protein